MTDDYACVPVCLSTVQALWLQELGVDRSLLARFAQPPKTQPAHKRSNRTDSDHARLDHGQVARPIQSPTSTFIPTPVPQEPAVLNDWAALEARILACEACDLHNSRQRVVPGSGATQAVQWMVIGEAPGERDDRQGEAFQGKAGQLLHAMLRAAGIDPQQGVFYTNLVKCRPRSNRLPSPQEIAACMPHLHNQIALLKPRGILLLGRLAAQTVLASKQRFEELRAKIHLYSYADGPGIPAVVTYHPAYLLSQPLHKAASWRDLNLALAALQPENQQTQSVARRS